MNTTSTRSDLADAIGRHGVSIAAYGAVICALSPILGLLRAGLWPVVFNGTLPVGAVLAAVALWTSPPSQASSRGCSCSSASSWRCDSPRPPPYNHAMDVSALFLGTAASAPTARR